MKKLLCIFIVTALLTGCAGFTGIAMADGDSIEFTPSLANAMDKTAKEWFASGEMRALLTVLIALDLMSDETHDISPDLTKPTFIGKQGFSLMLYYHADNQDIIVVYSPLLKNGAYQLTSTSIDAAVKYALSESATDGYYENDLEDILLVLQSLNDMLGK